MGHRNCNLHKECPKQQFYRFRQVREIILFLTYFIHRDFLSRRYRIISDRYWVSCNTSGKVEVWDLKCALNPAHTRSVLLHQLDATNLHCPLLYPVVRADEYQIALIPCRAKDYSELHIIDFLQLDEKAPIDRPID